MKPSLKQDYSFSGFWFSSVAAVFVLLALATLPAIVRLPVQVSLVCILPVLLHLIPRGKWRKVTTIGLLVMLVATIVISFDSWFGGDAIMAFICGLLWLKSSEMAGARDSWLLMLAVCIVTALNALFGISLWQMLHLLVVVWLLLLNVMILQSSDAKRAIGMLVRRSAFYFSISLPFAAILFFMLPRVPGPLWDVGIAMGMPVKMILEKTRTPAISGTLEVGQVSKLQKSDAPVLIAEFEGTIPSKSRLYWRGAVFWDYDGERWQLAEGWDRRRNIMHNALKGKQAFQSAITNGEDMVSYKVRVSPHDGHWLYGLDAPFKTAPETVLSKNYQLLSIRPLSREFEYEMKSYLKYQGTQPLLESQKDRALNIPDNTNPRITTLGQRIATENVSVDDRIAAATRWYYEAGLQHSLLNNIDVGPNNLDTFLFDEKFGGSEYLAGSFVMLMRAAGIPARLVTGYRGGNVIALTNFIVVKQGHAHAWLEVWTGNSGWSRIDPMDVVSTATVPAQKKPETAPQTEQQKQKNTQITKKKKDKKETSSLCEGEWFCSWLQNIEMWVVKFDAKKQLDTLDSIGLMRGTVGRMLLMTGVTIFLLMVFYMLMSELLKRRREDPLQLSYQRFATEMGKRGCEQGIGECPSVYCQRLSEQFPAHKDAIGTIICAYLDVQYGKKEENKLFTIMVKRFLAMTTGR